ncbi:prolyl 4-hydroxylase subunit alpha-2 isoform X2 [Dasypus novemcinctus]|uniref:prolyl 4-hydroxylase subunit alpha-2 isoform X2 n=1 Tax=Dasypus novemcinctus TaxID=9361 RepID=UPI0039C9AF3C
MKLEVATLVMAWFGLLGCTWADFFTSVGHMTSLIHVEKQLVQALKEYILLDEARLSMIKSWVEKRDALNLVIPEDEEGLSNSLDVYKILKHLNKDWSLVKSFVLQDPSPDSSHEQARLNLPYFVKLLEEGGTGKVGNRASETNSETLISTHEDSLNHMPSWEVYESLCRGEGVKLTPQKRKTLFCRYHHGNRTPQLLIAPFKEEDEWDSPHIVRYYDVLSDEEIKRIKEIAKPKMKRSRIYNYTTVSTHASISRISKSVFLKEKEDPLIRQVNRRIQLITGLSDKTAEYLQVAGYGIGGFYAPHVDFFLGLEYDLELVKEGNRVATFLNYMSDVEAGGATVFPELGAAIFPKKGSALFWYNLLRSGKGDHLTNHGSCPVLVGCKWVSNKWFHARGQEFLRPCGTTEVD